MKKKIPKIIRDKADSLGFNYIEPIGLLDDGGEAFALSVMDDNGFLLPVGLPFILVLKSGRITIIEGIEALDLL